MHYITTVLSLAFSNVLLLSYTALAQSVNSNTSGTSGRLWITVVAVIGLAGLILAGVALFRLKKHLSLGRKMAIVAIITGVGVTMYAGYHLTTFVGDFGTGNGRAGAIFTIVFGLTSISLGIIALIRYRRLS